MAKPEDVKNQIAKLPEQTDIIKLIGDSKNELGRALPAHMNAERITRIALTCVRLNPDLAKCTPASFLGALFTCAQIGLEPVAGQAYLIPFNNNKKKSDGTWHTVKEVQLVIGYQGATTLFYRHEKSLNLSWGVVYEKDDFRYQYGTEEFLRHIPTLLDDRGKVLGYYVVAAIQGGGRPFKFMTVKECLEHGKKHSKTFDKAANKGAGDFYKSSPWATSFDAMALKTVLFQLAKLLPKSTELQRALTTDETSREFRSGIENALDLPDQTNWIDGEAKELPELTEADKVAIEAEEKKQAERNQ